MTGLYQQQDEISIQHKSVTDIKFISEQFKRHSKFAQWQRLLTVQEYYR